MQNPFDSFLTKRLHCSAALSIVASWCAGLFLGCLVFFHADPEYFSWMRTACYRPVSIVGLSAVTLLPLLIYSISCFAFRSRLVLAFLFIKSFLFFICSAMVLSAFCSGGWLVRSLLMFTDNAIVFCMLWLYFRLMNSHHRRMRDLILYISCLGIIVCMDYFAISPYLARLLNEF